MRQGLVVLFVIAELFAAFAARSGAAVQTPPPGPPARAVDYVPLPARAVIAPTIDCAALAGRSFAEVKQGPARVVSAQLEPAANGRAEFCLVKGYVAPTIQFELGLPTKTYTGRYLQGGCGGNCGFIMRGFAPACDTPAALAGAFALGFEDSGHVGGDGVWALGGRQARVDFAYRAAHAFSQAAKAIIQAYYGQPPAFAYFQGCSDGGREAFAEAQRYPADFNGIVAGSAALLFTEAAERVIWEAKWGHDDQGRPIFDQVSLEALHAAVMSACDGLDGLRDGQIDDPRACRFDPAVLLCAPANANARCLTPPQVQAARRFYQGPVDRAGRHLYPGGEPYGAELTWAGRGALGEAAPQTIRENVRDMTFLGALPEGVDVQTWRFDAPTLRELRRRGHIYDADNPDLRPLKAAGGKLIIWYGAADPAAGSVALPDYYQRVQDRVGGLNVARGFVRMFPVPGVYHCGSGYLPYQEDFLGAMVAWVETGAAPDLMMASAQLPDGELRRRPVFAYPVRARYAGKGDIDDPASFVGRAPATPPNDHYPWLGASGS
jgi:feruloyl esterase